MRMGRDKALLDWGGAPLWRLQLAKLRELNPDRLLLSCREEQGLGEEPAETVFDPPGNRGPLGAIARCLEVVGEGRLLVLGVDMPRLSVAFLRSLIEPRDAKAGAVCRSPQGFEPLCAVYPAGALELFRDLLRRGCLDLQTAVGRLLDAGLMRARGLRPDELPLFFNANTPEEYEWTRPQPNAPT